VAKILEPGSLLDGDKYKIVRHLGEGGMGTVFEAEQRETHKRVAIKCLHPHQAGDPEITERLLREARATARVRHPNVVDIYDVGRDGPTVYLVMEYLDGEPMSHAIARNTLPPWEAVALLIDAMRGVAAAHNQGIVHRDVKPDNIFLAKVADAPRRVPKVLDFGISKLAWKTAEGRVLTRSGTAVGTPSYMSFEQLNGEQDIDGRADVYAFGVILYEILTGRVPYEADTFPQLLVRFATRLPVPPKQLRSEIPGTLNRVVMWSLEKERDVRIGSLDAFIRELEPFATRHSFEAEQTGSGRIPTPSKIDGEAPTAQHSSAQPRTHARVTMPAKRMRSVALLLTAAVLAALAFVLTRGMQPRATEQSTSAATSAAPMRPAPPAPVLMPTKAAAVLTPAVAPRSQTQTPAPKPADAQLPQGQTPPKGAVPAPRPVVPARPVGPRPRDIGIY